MTKKEYCLTHDTVAVYYDGLNGVEIKGIEYGIEDYLYCMRGGATSQPSYHRLKIHYGPRASWVFLGRRRIPLGECLRV